MFPEQERSCHSVVSLGNMDLRLLQSTVCVVVLGNYPKLQLFVTRMLTGMGQRNHITVAIFPLGFFFPLGLIKGAGLVLNFEALGDLGPAYLKAYLLSYEPVDYSVPCGSPDSGDPAI